MLHKRTSVAHSTTAMLWSTCIAFLLRWNAAAAVDDASAGDLLWGDLQKPAAGQRNAAKLSYAEKWHKNEPKMGVKNYDCDDAQHDLEVDWPGKSALEYTCDEEHDWPVTWSKSVAECHPEEGKNDNRMHICMNDKPHYEEVPPVSGNHRPLWPRYGEYQYVPPARWMHNLEHGAVNLLYHPCADQMEVEKLKDVLRGCLRRHVITPYRHLPKETPMALVAWGCRLLMSHADVESSYRFILAHAKKTEENLSKDGQYDLALMQAAQVVDGSDYEDNNICPGYTQKKIVAKKDTEMPVMFMDSPVGRQVHEHMKRRSRS